MLKLSAEDTIKAAESLAFANFTNDQFGRSLRSLPSSELESLASTLEKDSVGPATVGAVAKTLGAGKPLGRMAKKWGVKAMQLARGRPFTQMFKSYKGEKGVKAVISRFKDRPGYAAAQAAKGLAVPGAALVGGAKLLSE